MSTDPVTIKPTQSWDAWKYDHRCIMCGAEPGDPCVVGEYGPGENPERVEPHFYRGAAHRTSGCDCADRRSA